MKRGYFLVFLAAFFWSTLGPLGKILYKFKLSTYTILFYRVFFAFICFGIYNVLRKTCLKISFKSFIFLFIYSFTSVFLFYFFYFYTIKVFSISLAVLLLYTAPIYSLIFGKIFFKENLTFSKIVAIIFGILGIFLVVLDNLSLSHFSKTGFSIYKGLITGLLAGLTYAIYGIFGKYVVKKEPVEKVLFYILGIGSCLFLPFAKLNVPISSFLYLIFLGVFPTFLAYILFTEALKEVEISRASIVAIAEPVFALIWAFIFFKEKLTFLQFTGAFFVLFSTFLASRK